MGISEIFWGFFILSMLQPVLQKKLQQLARRRMIAHIESTRASRVILLVHRQETMSLLGFPVLRYIDIHDSEEVLHAIQMTDSNVPIDLVLHTPGGLVLRFIIDAQVTLPPLGRGIGPLREPFVGPRSLLTALPVWCGQISTEKALGIG